MGHHATVIACLILIVGSEAHGLADYLDACRSKRNTVDYDGIDIATEADVAELITEVQALQPMVVTWLTDHHPELIEQA